MPLDRGSVEGIVFWTKNIHPFFRHLQEVRDRGYPFVVQHTINGYPRVLETSVVDAEIAVENAWRLRETYGPHVLVWRYDTIVLTSLTPAEYHAENFARLARRLRGASDEVVVSFAQIYRKTERNMDAAAKTAIFSWTDPSDDEKRDLLARLLGIARENGFQLTVCSQRSLLVAGVGDARCVDARRLESIGGRPFPAKLKGNRKDCGCYASRDIGEYDTCPHGCVYCYAVQNRPLALDRHRKHDPASEFLLQPDGADANRPQPRSLPLFPGS